MKNNSQSVLKKTLTQIFENRLCPHAPLCIETDAMPNQKEIEDIILSLHRILFPGFFEHETQKVLLSEDDVDQLLYQTHHRLKRQIVKAFSLSIEKKAEDICNAFFEELPVVQRKLQQDAEAGFVGDPAAYSKEEIIFCYPGFYAISIYRMAHILYTQGVPLIPRIMTEHAHSKTGIDINSGAVIGDHFFIDHGTGVVIGETCVIGDNVKIYQGVTLGALSTRGGQQLAGVRRHPTVEDNVTIYAGATILGGETVIGENSVIGGNCFITKPIPKNTKVFAALQELTLKSGNINKE